MYRVFAMCLEAGIAAVILIPAFWVLNRYYFRNFRRTACYLVLSLYLAAVDAVVGLPSLLYIRFVRNINLVPFAYMFSDYRNSLLNVLRLCRWAFFCLYCGSGSALLGGLHCLASAFRCPLSFCS